MNPLPFHSLLLVGVLVLALQPLPLNAADRAGSLQTATSQSATPVPKKKSFFGRLFSSKTRDDSRRSSAPVSAFGAAQPARPIYTPPNPQDPALQAASNTQRSSTSRVVIAHDSKASKTATAALDLAVPAPASGETATSTNTDVVAETRAAIFLFATPVPGKPGLVYPPGAERIPTNVVDVSGLTPGSKARDPLTKIIFLVP